MPGSHNVSNALAVWAAARHDGLPAAEVAAALAQFRGIRRRLEDIGSRAGVSVIDDFAHHPTAIEKSLEGLRQRYPGRRLLACFEPRSLTAGRSFLFAAYLKAFALADIVFLAPIFHYKRIADNERLDLTALSRRLEEVGTQTRICTSIDQILAQALDCCQEGDVLVTMSSGSFDGLPLRLLECLGKKSS
jgi:UDP-N-acetylmuramate: L-alanyl-gamma-D-glutamyl-meso-diaminopimelate ligase